MSILSKIYLADVPSVLNSKNMLKASCSAVLIITLGACSSSDAQVTMAQHQAENEVVTPAIEDEDSFQLLADQMVEAGDYAAAVPLYRHLLKGYSGDGAVQTKLGLALLALGNITEAERALASAVNNDEVGDANYGLGKVHLALGRYAEAAAQFAVASDYMDDAAKAHSGRGIALAAMGNFDDSIAAFDDGLRANPDDTETLSNKALTMALLGSADVAITMLEDIAQSGRAGPRDRQNLALAYLASGRRTDAVAMARLDLDAQAVADTFSFYDEMMALPPKNRMASLVTGMIPQAHNEEKVANLELVDSEDRRAAAARMTAPPPPPPPPEPKPEPVIPPIETETPQDRTGWAVQIGAYRTIENMVRGWNILYTRNEDILEGVEPRRSEVSFGDRENAGPQGHYYRLNVGNLKTFERATSICEAFIDQGTDCWVRPPEPAEGRLPD